MRKEINALENETFSGFYALLRDYFLPTGKYGCGPGGGEDEAENGAGTPETFASFQRKWQELGLAFEEVFVSECGGDLARFDQILRNMCGEGIHGSPIVDATEISEGKSYARKRRLSGAAGDRRSSEVGLCF